MAKIYAPNKEYTGISATVAFAKGTGETNDEHLIEWFREHGYKVEEVEKKTPENDGNDGNGGNKELADMTVEELTAYAQEKKIDLGQATTQAGILKKIQEAENNTGE